MGIIPVYVRFTEMSYIFIAPLHFMLNKSHFPCFTERYIRIRCWPVNDMLDRWRKTLTAVWVVGQLYVWRFFHQNFSRSLFMVIQWLNEIYIAGIKHTWEMFQWYSVTFIFWFLQILPLTLGFHAKVKFCWSGLTKWILLSSPVNKCVVYTTETTILMF